MVVFNVLQFIGGLEFRVSIEERVIKKADMDDGFDVIIILTPVKLVKGAAQIADGTVGPVEFICDLHFKIKKKRIIYDDLDVKPEFFVSDRFAQNR